MLKKLLVGLVLMAMVLPGHKVRASDVSTGNFAVLYDLDSTTATYCRVTGENGAVINAAGMAGDGKIETSGSSSTTTEVADTDPFADLAVGDIMTVDFGTGSQNALARALAVKGSASSITASSAWNLDVEGGINFRWYKTTCGTTATDGWVDVQGFDKIVITFGLEQINATGGIDVQIQCRTSGLNAQAIQVFPSCTTGSCNTYQNYATAGIASSTAIVGNEPWGQCRVGMKIGSADDGTDTTTLAERINISLTLEKATR